MKAVLLSRRHRAQGDCDVCSDAHWNARMVQFVFHPQSNGTMNITQPQFLRVCGGCLREGVRILAKKTTKRTK